MTTDYDAPRARVDTDPAPDGGLLVKTRRSDAAAATLTIDDDADGGYASSAGPLELLTGDDLTITVVAQRPDEFTCARCFLIQHRSRHRSTLGKEPICRDCT